MIKTLTQKTKSSFAFYATWSASYCFIFFSCHLNITKEKKKLPTDI